MNSLGIYFGIKDIHLVETSGRKVLNNIRLPNPMAAIAELEDKVPADIKLIAMLKDAFRSYRINVKEAVFCISGHDMVIRTFEIPIIPQSELRGAVSFEVKKYIPFKLEELDFDFQVLLNKSNKTNLVLFCGIKKEVLESYISIANQLNLKVDIIEYSAFSILRFLKLVGIRDSGVVASLGFDLDNEDEANFTVFENGFSLFSRDFTFAAEEVGFEQATEEDLAQKLSKLKNEIRVSLDYYNRNFPEKAIKEIYIISDKECQEVLKTFFKDSAISAKFVDTKKAKGKEIAYSFSFIKSFSASLFKLAPLKIKINLVSAKLKAAKATRAATIGRKVSVSLEGIKLDFKFVVFGIAICAIVLGYGIMRMYPMHQELTVIKSKRVKINTAVLKDDLQALSELNLEFKKKISVLDDLVKNQMYLTYPLDAIPRALTEGMWLESFKFDQKNDKSSELNLEGLVYLEDSNKEFELVNFFVSNLKNEPEFSKYFKEINIKSINQKQMDGKNITAFSISCRSYPEKN